MTATLTESVTSAASGSAEWYRDYLRHPGEMREMPSDFIHRYIIKMDWALTKTSRTRADIGVTEEEVGRWRYIQKLQHIRSIAESAILMMTAGEALDPSFAKMIREQAEKL